NTNWHHNTGGGCVRFVSTWEQLNNAQGADPNRQVHSDEQQTVILVTPGTNLIQIEEILRARGITAYSTGFSSATIGSFMSLKSEASVEDVVNAVSQCPELVADQGSFTPKEYKDIPTTPFREGR